MVKNPSASAGDSRNVGSLPTGKTPCSRKWQPTPVFSPGDSHGWSSLAGCRTHKVLDTTQHLSTHAHTPQSAQAEIPASTASQRLPQGGEGRGCNRAQSDPSRPAWSLLLPQQKHAESQPRELWSGSETEPRRYLGLLA